ncbi:MAG: right-handed parallel beta-helix repeat-containing protein [Paracoccaceae bacterium]
MAVTVTVSSAAELYAAVDKATSDTTIVMKEGNYGNLDLSAHYHPKVAQSFGLNFVAEDADNPPVITGLLLRDAKNVTLDGILFDYTAKPKADIAYKPFWIEDCTDVVIKNSTFDGSHASGFGNYNDGYGAGTALFVRGGQDVVIENNKMHNFYRGLVVFESDNITVRGNEIYDQSSDGLNFAQVTDLLIEKNYIHDFDAAANTQAHKDMIQFWTTNTTSATQRVVIRDNVLDSGSGVATHSLTIFNERGGFAATIYRDITIENNVIRNAHKHGITVEYAVGVKINNNTLIQNLDQAKDASGLYLPSINIWKGATQVTVNKNVTHLIEGPHTGSGNYFIQRDAPTQEGYYGDLFLNALSDEHGIWEDLMIAPGGYLAVNKLGSSLLYFDTTPEEATPLVLMERGVNLELGHFELDASRVYGPNGQLSVAGAKAVWDFGDGTKGTGLLTEHTYAKPGVYHITGTITLANGQKFEVKKTVESETPAALQTDMSNSGQDTSGQVSLCKVEGAVSFVTDGGSVAAKLGASGRICYQKSAEFFDNTSYTVLADFRKDQISDRGKLISFLGSFVITVTEHTISASVITDKGTKLLAKSYMNLSDTKWHNIALTFDGKTGEASLYFDGKEIAFTTGLQGAIQVGNDSQHFYVGSPGGDSFNGLVDDVHFLRGAMTGNDVANLYMGKTTVAQLLKDYAPSAPVVIPDPADDGGTDAVPADAITGTTASEKLVGTGDGDTILGLAGNDTLIGQRGDDTIDGGAGADSVSGGYGNDSVYFDAADAMLHGGFGTDTLVFKGGSYDATDVALRAFEVFDMTNGNVDALRMSFNQLKQNPDTALRIDGDVVDTVVIEANTELRKLSTYTLDGETYTRYALGEGSWAVQFSADSDITITTAALIA